MILEVRHYTLKSGRREEFIRFFEQHNRNALRNAGMLVFGPLRDLEDENKVHWIRAFSSLEEREKLKDAFYNGPIWKNEIEPFAMPMIDHFEAELTEITSGFQSFVGDTQLR